MLKRRAGTDSWAPAPRFQVTSKWSPKSSISISKCSWKVFKSRSTRCLRLQTNSRAIIFSQILFFLSIAMPIQCFGIRKSSLQPLWHWWTRISKIEVCWLQYENYNDGLAMRRPTTRQGMRAEGQYLALLKPFTEVSLTNCAEKISVILNSVTTQRLNCINWCLNVLLG